MLSYLFIKHRHSLVSVSPAPGNTPSSKANGRAVGSSFHSDGSVAQLGLHVTSHHLRPPSPAKVSRLGPTFRLAPPPYSQSSSFAGP